MKFRLDISEFVRLAEQLEGVGPYLDKGAQNGMEKAVEIWKTRTLNHPEMPQRRSGNLSDSVTTMTNGTKLRHITGAVSANAYSDWKGKPFNYGYYLHEHKDRPFLIEGYKDSEKQMKEALKKSIVNELKKGGW